MSVKTGNIERKFSIKVDGKQIELEDPNPNFTPKEVMDLYIPQYPQLLNGSIETKGIVDDKQTFEFVTVVGTKG